MFEIYVNVVFVQNTLIGEASIVLYISMEECHDCFGSNKYVFNREGILDKCKNIFMQPNFYIHVYVVFVQKVCLDMSTIDFILHFQGTVPLLLHSKPITMVVQNTVM